MSRYNTQVLSNIRMLCRMQNIDEKVLYERAKLILSIYREVCWSTIDRANDVCDTLICTYGDSLDELNQFIPFQTVTGVLDVSGIHYHFPNKNQCLRSYQSNLSFMTTNRNTAMQSMQTLILVSLPCLSNSRSPLSKHHS
jgi:hypothetical protein